MSTLETLLITLHNEGNIKLLKQNLKYILVEYILRFLPDHIPIILQYYTQEQIEACYPGKNILIVHTRQLYLIKIILPYNI